jgi:hypothetical protein
MMLETATDIGLLKIDPQRREIRFEGDNERYRIPAAALIDCPVEAVMPVVSQSRGDELYLVLIIAEGPEGTWEAPLGPRDMGGLRSRKWRENWAFALQDRILALMGRTRRSAF